MNSLYDNDTPKRAVLDALIKHLESSKVRPEGLASFVDILAKWHPAEYFRWSIVPVVVPTRYGARKPPATIPAFIHTSLSVRAA